ncbi:MAG: hypothetical protein ACXVAX_02935 [Pseudobdellovibrio sp.]
MNLILSALKNVFLAGSVFKCELEALIKWDFKIGSGRENLMQLCFSSLAAWPLLLGLLIISLDPFKTSFSLVNLLSYDNPFVLALLDGRTNMMLLFFAVFFVGEWLFRQSSYFILILAYLMNRSELHINLAIISMMAILLSQNCYLWWAVVDIKSETKLIWQRVQLLQFISWIISVVSALRALDYLQINHLFNEETYLNRMNFTVIVLVFYLVVRFLLLSIWGHFYFKKTQDPSFLGLHYSTSQWFLRFAISDGLEKTLKESVEQQLQQHQANARNFVELKMQNPGLGRLPLEVVLTSEIEYLKESLLRLSKI